jgi:hypothetical protein
MAGSKVVVSSRDHDAKAFNVVVNESRKLVKLLQTSLGDLRGRVSYWFKRPDLPPVATRALVGGALHATGQQV